MSHLLFFLLAAQVQPTFRSPNFHSEAALVYVDAEVLQERQRHSLMELAGLDTDDAKAPKRATRAPNVIERVSAD